MNGDSRFFCRRVFREYLCKEKGIDRQYLINLMKQSRLLGTLNPEYVVDKWLEGVLVTQLQNSCVLKLYEEMSKAGICEKSLLVNDGCASSYEVSKLLKGTKQGNITWSFDGIELFKSSKHEGKEFYLYKDACFNIIKSTKHDETDVTESKSYFLNEESLDFCNEFIQWCCKGIYDIISPQFLKDGKQYEYSGFSV